MKVRRVVTGHDAQGKAIIADDSLVEPITLDLLPGYEFHRLWGRDETPTFPDDGGPRPAVEYFPPSDGSRFAVFTLPPDTQAIRSGDLDVAAALAEMEVALPGMARHMEPDNPGMHRTDSIDYLYVASGQATLELDDGVEVDVRAGDTIVQNGTRHAWRNRSNEPCVIVVALIGAQAGNSA
jgi:mannose-6-phosphate isomerase-like protein (cupin superfamily)